MVTLFGFLIPSLALVYTDARYYRLPNLIVYPLWLGGLAWSAYRHEVLFSLLGSLVGFGLLFLIRLLFVFYSSDQEERKVQPLGGGDIKCAGMIGAWLGPQGVLLVILIGSLLGIAWGMGRLWFSRSLGLWVLTFGINNPPDTLADPRVVPAGACLVVAAWTVWMMGGGISAVL